jgi:hypothetical protein
LKRNETGSSQAMEYQGFQRSMEFVFSEELNMTIFISDRHTSIKKHMREQLPKVIHYFDLWHLTKSKMELTEGIFSYIP